MKERYRGLMDKVYRLGDLSPGSIQTRWTTCGNPNCKCARGDKHGPYYYLSYRDRSTGKMKHVYLRKDEIPRLEERIGNYEALKDELWELAEIENEMRKGE